MKLTGHDNDDVNWSLIIKVASYREVCSPLVTCSFFFFSVRVMRLRAAAGVRRIIGAVSCQMAVVTYWKYAHLADKYGENVRPCFHKHVV